MIKSCIPIALQAGKAILEVYQTDFSVIQKEDQSPLTLADTLSNQIIEKGLKSISTYPIVSEEGENIAYEIRKTFNPYWLVDPLDGTKEFVKKNGEFTVNIALIEDHIPIAGVVYAPVLQTLYFADGNGAFKCEQCDPETSLETIESNAIRLEKSQQPVKDHLVIVASKSHLSEETQAFIDSMQQIYQKVDLISAGSSLKFGLVAEGKAHVYPRFAPTMEWDTGAGHAICSMAGFEVNRYPEGVPLQYSKDDLRNPFFIVM
jgi:3'(2'), 5'-bisphosphate nucleotidase